MSKTQLYNCEDCDRGYNYKKNLRKHISKAHPEKIDGQRKPNRVNGEKQKNHTTKSFKKKLCELNCFLCNFKTSLNKQLFEHFKAGHNISIETEELTFSSFEEFKNWKEAVEKKTVCKFLKKCGVAAGTNNSKRHYFVCHRSGRNVSTSTGRRQPRAQGSKKINGICPASIKIYEAGDGSCSGKFVRTHVGHENDIAHVGLSEADKKAVLADITNTVPFEEILKKAHAGPSSVPKRMNLLTRKDLHNIKNAGEKKSGLLRNCDRDAIEELSPTKDENKSGESSKLIFTNKESGFQLIETCWVNGSNPTGKVSLTIKYIEESAENQNECLDEFNQKQQSNLTYEAPNNLENCFDTPEYLTLENCVFEEISDPVCVFGSSSLSVDKEQIRERFHKLLDTVTSDEELKAVNQSVTKLEEKHYGNLVDVGWLELMNPEKRL